VDGRLESHSVLEREVTFHELGEDRLQPGVSTLERKPTLPRFTPSNGTSTSATARAARRKVPSPPRTTKAPVFRQALHEGRQLAGRCRPVVYAADLAPSLGSFEQIQRRLFSWVVGEAEAIRPSCPGQLSKSRQPLVRQGRGSSSRGTNAGGTSNSRKNSRLPAGPVSGEAMALRNFSPMPRRVARHRLQRLAVNLRVADDAVAYLLASRLELRLHEGHDQAARRPKAGSHRPKNAIQEMNETSTTARSTGARQDARTKSPSICPLHRDYARVVAQSLGQLATAHVHRIHLAGIPLQQQIREAARRRADVQTHETDRLDSEDVQGGPQLQTSA
jgi:hypothetical protein